MRHVGQELGLVLAGDFDLATLLRDLSITGLQFFEQPHVLDGDHSLVCERLEERDVMLGKRYGLSPRNTNSPDGLAVANHWDHDDAAVSDGLCSSEQRG